MKNFFKFVCFNLIFILLFKYIFTILWLPKNSISFFYDEPENSIDIIYIGGSNVHHHFNNLLAYHLYGFTTYLLSSGIQPFTLTKSLIEESRKYQNPKLYIIDLARLTDDFASSYNESWSRVVVDSLKNSKTRIMAVNELLKNAKIEKSQYVNYYFSFFKYHNSWKDIKRQNFDSTLNEFKGYYAYDYAFDIKPQEEFVWRDEIETLQPDNEVVLLDLINYIENNDLNVLFVIPKSTYWSPNYERLNYATKIIENHNLNVINFNKIDDSNFDLNYETDFYDKIHLNVYGATKYTLYFSKYLKDNYNLVNHKNDEKFLSWNEEYERFVDKFNLVTGKNFDNILEMYLK